MINGKKLLVIIPAYNESECIERVVNNIIDNYPQYDYIIVNDGSTDDTRHICIQNQYHFLDLPVNVGLQGAIKTGMKYAACYDYDCAVQLDGDGQHDPKYIADMLKCMEESGADIVSGSRFKDVPKPKSSRMIGSRLIAGAIFITTKGKKLSDPTSGMRLFNRVMIRQFANEMHFSPEPDTMAFLLNNGIKIEEVQVEMHERLAGKSYLNFKNSIWYMMKMMFSILIFQWVRKRQ